jgi:rubrerythrin
LKSRGAFFPAHCSIDEVTDAMALSSMPFFHVAAALLGGEDDSSDWPALRDLQLDDSGGARELRGVVSARVLLLLGAELSAADYERARLSPLRASLPGEIVAVEGDKGVLRYARVVEEDGDDAEACGTDVKVQVSRSCIRWYASSQLRYFPSALSDISAEERLRDKLGGSSMECAAWDAAGTVNAANVAAAVNALLARLNLSLGATQREMLAEMQQLSVRVTLAEENHRAALRRVETLLLDKYQAQKALVCAVCMDHGIDRALVPCGHVFCAACVRRLQPAVCPLCRQDFASSAAVRIP